MAYLEDILNLGSENNFSFITMTFPIDIGSHSMLARVKAIQEQVTSVKNSYHLMVS